MAWDWAVIGTAVGGFSTMIYTGFTYALLRENRALRKAGRSPQVVAHFEQHPDGNGALQLAFSNVGTGPALDVCYSFEREAGDFENYHILFKHAEERPALTMIGQGEKFSFTFAIGFNLFNPKDANVSRRLRPFYVNVSWRAAGEKKLSTEKYLLDISAYAGLPGLIEKPSIAKIADALGDIKKHLATLAQTADARIRLIDATSIEENKRKVVPVQQPLSDEEQS
ncbi:hypothetical protein BRN76_12445 [Xanthomonas oryzae pv. oryzae]|uniref:hypothetical protein n=1 Tax=Xanthomonas oryzae TaxID=347 RepID=UPI0002DC08FF|nr:hypothetical protein [Xanthomonas oryzae]QBN86292.1 hypothetical protein EBA17_06515 [Xanthomonas oryzae pv. oryzae]QBN95672.1 hypothetical protein EBA19_18555 [Xanthomonas oryzae pv. oryzae]QBN97914.1 hypothetical protein EBA20_06855 [Xanthomonas oryzae pv. oryzae]QIF24154.1 hypothetical protein G6N84_21380 [Xanthomonas oryzae pv. oryzae]RBA84316.1 hypothetical protein BRN79_24080 [Xanthomonas oryzae pv. oryzae]